MDTRRGLSPLLSFTGVALTEWLLVTAEITRQFQYYFWALVVVIAWSEAAHVRSPDLYPQRPVRLTIFFTIFFMLLMFNKMIVYIQQNGIPLP